MNKFLKIILSSFILTVCFSSVFALKANAQSDEIDVNFNSDPLFKNVGNFAPGDKVSSGVEVVNKTQEAMQIGLELTDNTDCNQDCLAEALYLSVKKNGNVLINSSLSAIYESGEVLLDELEGNSDADYDLTVSFEEDAGDSYQGGFAGFDLRVGVFGKESISEEVSSSGGGGGSSFFVQGLKISNESASVTSGKNIEITWTTSKKSTSRVIYSPSNLPHNLKPNTPPNYGYAYSTGETDNPADLNGVTFHKVVLVDLMPNTKYYFRCVSHASPDTVSRERSFTTGDFEKPADEEVKNHKEQKDEYNKISGDDKIVVLEKEELNVGSGEREIKKTETETKAGEEEKEALTGSEKDSKEQNQDKKSSGSFLAGVGSVFNLRSLSIVLIVLAVALLVYWFLKRKKSNH